MKSLLTVTLLILTGFSLVASDDVGWRLDGDGIFPEAKPPITFSNDEGVVWKTKLPDWSNAMPIMVGNKLFINVEPFTLMCLDAQTGKVLWQADNSYEDILDDTLVKKYEAMAEEKAGPIREQMKVVEGEMDELRKEWNEKPDERQKIRGRMRGKRLKMTQLTKQLNEVAPLNLPNKHEDNGYSSPVPVSDGKHVYVVYGNGVAAAYDLDGNRKWAKKLEKPTHGFGHSTSPVLIGDVVIFHILQVRGLNKNTGEELWTAEAKEGWGSPISVTVGGKELYLTSREGTFIDPADGTIVAEKKAGMIYATPFVKDGILYSIEGDARAYKLPDTVEGLAEMQPLWQTKIKGSRHYASSIMHDGLIYAVSREAWVNVIEASSGEIVYEKRLDIAGDNVNSVYPSLTMAGGNIYLGNQEGIMLVLEPGREYKELARNTLEGFRSTPIFKGERMYLRGFEHMFAFGK